jgi:hypothetical protein
VIPREEAGECFLSLPHSVVVSGTDRCRRHVIRASESREGFNIKMGGESS